MPPPGIVAGFLVQNTLKYLLNFGTVGHYLGYNSLQDFFPTMTIKPNPGCANPLCAQRQREWEAAEPEREAARRLQLPPEEDVGPLHEDNEWAIEVVRGEGEEEHEEGGGEGRRRPDAGASGGVRQQQGGQLGEQLPDGIKYSMPVRFDLICFALIYVHPPPHPTPSPANTHTHSIYVW